MKTTQMIFGIIAMITLLPTFLLFPALIITGIMGLIKKDYSYLKKISKNLGVQSFRFNW